MPKSPHEENKMKQIAKLDENNIYHGIEEIEDDALQPHHIELPEGCDLPPGKYQWSGETFIPMRNPQRLKTSDPDALNAIAIGFISLQQSGAALPEETLEWLDHYITTQDFELRPTDINKPESLHMVKAFKSRGG
jgi:hypothetical protein